MAPGATNHITNGAICGPDVNTWTYYSTMCVTHVVIKDSLIANLSIPLIDKSLEVVLYQVYNLPALQPEIKVQFTCVFEEQYLVICKLVHMLSYSPCLKFISILQQKIIYVF